MEIIDIKLALPRIQELLELASNGTEMIITKHEQPMVKLVSLKANRQRPPLFGSDRDLVSVADDFDAPLSDFQDYS